MSGHYLRRLFEPRSVVLFGATDTPDSVGRVVTENFVGGGFEGEIYLVNPGHESIFGQTCYHSLADIPDTADLAVIATPAATVPDIIGECGERGIRAAIIISAGFREVGVQGKKLEDQVIGIAARYGIRIIGPNSLGVIRPSSGLNATFTNCMVRQGKLALISQSGAICTAILDWAQNEGIGFSCVVSMVASADINFGEVLDFLVSDPQTQAILLYIEGIENARGFMGGLRAAASAKPLVVIKTGRNQAARQAAKSHTGAIVGDDAVFDAALRRAGVVRGHCIKDLFVAASALSRGFKLYGERLLILTNGGGPGTMACDHASDLDIPLAKLSEATISRLNEVLPATWSHQNPVDIGGDADPERYRRAMEICLEDESVDALLVILAPTALNDPEAVANVLIQQARGANRPILTCWMGSALVASGVEKLHVAGIANFDTPEEAVEAFAYLDGFYRNQQLLLQVPPSLSCAEQPDIEGVKLIIESVLAENRDTLTETESKAVLAAFDIPVNQTSIAHDSTEALVLAESLGLPVVMKVHSKRISHKSDVGGVKTGLSDAAQVRKAYRDIIENVRKHNPDEKIDSVTVQKMVSSRHGREVMIGATSDPLFGPVISFGSGGTSVEILQDQAVALPPLNRLLAEDLIQRTRVSKLMLAYRDVPAASRDAIIDILLRISDLLCELPWIKEIDLNPVIVDEDSALVVDARMVVGHGRYQLDRYSHLAIHPYPSQFVVMQQLPDGTDLCIRPIRPEDAEIEQSFVRGLSGQSKYFRFMANLRELTPAMLRRFTQLDYDREMALIAVVVVDGKEKEIGVSRYVTNPDGRSCEFAVVVADDWQNFGIGWRLMEQLEKIARHRGLEEMEGVVLSRNTKMLAFCAELGFSVEPDPNERDLMRVVKRLQG